MSMISDNSRQNYKKYDKIATDVVHFFVFLQGMKIFTSRQIKEWDQYTIEHEPVKSIDLMERAAEAVVGEICSRWEPMKTVVFAGPGNNGGDALAVARLLAERDFKVSVYLFNIHNNLSLDCTASLKRLTDAGKIEEFVEVKVDFDPPVLDSDTLVVDGLFGAGADKPLAGGFASLVRYINQSSSPVVSIDMPSGLMPEDNSSNVRANIVRATLTLTFQQPKLSMLFADNQACLGEVKVLDIRLDKTFAEKKDCRFSLVDETWLRSWLQRRDAFVHKGDMGHAFLVAGSYGMAGAAVLAARACMRSGVGKLSVYTPKVNYTVMQTAVPEAVLQIGNNEHKFIEAVDTSKYSAMGIGPGLGTDESTALALISQLRRATCPIVIDADALNILASHRAWLQQLPKDSILTPHPKEMERLLGSSSHDCCELLNRTSEMASRLQIYILLKGHHSALCLPSGQVVFNTTGNAGMATAGSGDVLTGIITGLLARGYQPHRACILGMYLHGLAGDLAERSVGMESLVASDIIKWLPSAFRRLDD